MEKELNEWLKYLEKNELLANCDIPLTEYQKEDIEYTKKKTEELKKEINEKRRENSNK